MTKSGQGNTGQLHHCPTAFGCADHGSPTKESVFCFEKRSALRWLMQCAAMADAARCIGTCTALRFSGHCFPSVRRAGPMVQLDLGHRPYNPAHASCIFCFIGAKNTTDISAHSSPLSKENLFKLPSRTGTLSIRGSPNHQQGAPLCSKKTPRSAAKPHTLCPKKFY